MKLPLSLFFLLISSLSGICANGPQGDPAAITSVDPAYSRTAVVPQPAPTEGAPWLYADTELEAYRHALLRRRVKEAGLKVGYPGKFYDYKNKAQFRFTPSAGMPVGNLHVVGIHACGDISVEQDGRTVYKAKDRKDIHHVMLASGMDFTVSLHTSDGPPALRIPSGDFSTEKDGWRARSCSQPWNYPCAYPARTDGILPHRAETPTLTLKSESKEGDLYDFGREIFGHITFRASKQPEFYAGESIPEARDTTPADREQSFALAEIAPGVWRTRAPLGFRYLTVPGTDVSEIQCEAYTYPVQYRGELTSSDPRLDRIWMNSAYTLRLCMHEFHLDGMKRDRLPWAGDIATSLMVNAYTFADPEIVRRSLALLGREGIAETDINGIIDYSLWWLISQDHYQLYFGDMLHLRREWNRVKAAAEVLESRCDANGLLPFNNTWLFIDWVDVEKECAMEVLWWWAQRSMANLADRMGEPEVAGYWREKSETLKTVLTARGYDPQRQAWRGLLRETSGPNRHANFLAVISGLAPAEHYPGIVRILTDPAVQQVGTPYMAFFEYMALARLGRAEEMLTRMRDYWGGMIDRGATSFWEGYDPAEGEDKMYRFYDRPWGKSLCHGWSSGPAALIPGEMLGIRPLEDGWKTFSVEPGIASVKELRAVIPTPQGEIRATLRNGKISVEIPEGCTALYRGERRTGKI